MSVINMFKGEYAFLSNFSTINIEIKGQVWPTSEHMYMACKTTDPAVQEQIRKAYTPGYAKKLGRQLQLRPDWEQIKDEAMLRVLRAKFKGNEEHRNKLLATGNDTLIEGNYWHDNYWGSCMCQRCGNQGKNMLGKLLMQVREELQK